MGTQMKSHEAVRRLAMAAMLTAIATVLQIMEFPVSFLMPPFIKMDFSDLPALLGAYSLGPWWGVLIQLAKNLLHLPFSSSVGVGELCNFLFGSVFVLVAGLVYFRHKSRKTALIGAVLGSVAMALVSLPLNYFFVYPAYVVLYHMPLEGIIGMYEKLLGGVAKFPTANALFNCLLIFNVPFTLVKGLLNMLICFFIYKPLSRTILSKELLSEEEKEMTSVDYRKRRRNLWILVAVGILLLLVQAFLWAVKLFPETFAFAEVFVKAIGKMNGLLTGSEHTWIVKALIVLAFNAVGVIGALCVVLGAVNLVRIKKHQAALIAEENAQEAKPAQDADPAEESANSDE